LTRSVRRWLELGLMLVNAILFSYNAKSQTIGLAILVSIVLLTITLVASGTQGQIKQITDARQNGEYNVVNDMEDRLPGVLLDSGISIILIIHGPFWPHLFENQFTQWMLIQYDS
jgi:hypothetical protein